MRTFLVLIAKIPTWPAKNRKIVSGKSSLAYPAAFNRRLHYEVNGIKNRYCNAGSECFFFFPIFFLVVLSEWPIRIPPFHSGPNRTDKTNFVFILDTMRISHRSRAHDSVSIYNLEMGGGEGWWKNRADIIYDISSGRIPRGKKKRVTDKNMKKKKKNTASLQGYNKITRYCRCCI